MPPEGAFTEHDTRALRERITRDLAWIAAHVRRADPRYHALVLTGGFSRGEGTTRGGAPVNDYDLVVLRDAPGGGARYAKLADALTAQLGLHVDLLPVWRARLPRVGRKLFWLDLRLGGRVVDGPADALATLRSFPASEVARVESARLLGNRAAGMLLSLPAPGEPLDIHQRDLQATKAVLAAMDAHLLSIGRYTARMRDRLALTKEHRHHAIFAHAVEWKLREQHTLPNGWWETARDTLLAAIDETGARSMRDGVVEHALHLAKARRLRRSPSQAVRRAAWDLLAISVYPAGPAHLPSASSALRQLGIRVDPEWGAVKRSFFAARARTLQ